MTSPVRPIDEAGRLKSAIDVMNKIALEGYHSEGFASYVNKGKVPAVVAQILFNKTYQGAVTRYNSAVRAGSYSISKYPILTETAEKIIDKPIHSVSCNDPLLVEENELKVKLPYRGIIESSVIPKMFFDGKLRYEDLVEKNKSLYFEMIYRAKSTTKEPLLVSAFQIENAEYKAIVIHPAKPTVECECLYLALVYTNSGTPISYYTLELMEPDSYILAMQKTNGTRFLLDNDQGESMSEWFDIFMSAIGFENELTDRPERNVIESESDVTSNEEESEVLISSDKEEVAIDIETTSTDQPVKEDNGTIEVNTEADREEKVIYSENITEDDYDEIYGNDPKTMKRLVCTHCGRELPSDALFCFRCGERVEFPKKIITCPRCSKKVFNRYYCSECGTEL